MRLFAIAIVLTLATTPAVAAAQGAPPSDSGAVIGVVQRFFDAMSHRDTTAARATMVSGAQLVSIVSGSNAAAPRRESDSSFIARLVTDKKGFLERMWNPRVRVEGDIAELWTPYDFHLGGKFSHCGIDAFTLLRTAKGWQIASIAYTVQRTGCAASPLGPPTS